MSRNTYVSRRRLLQTLAAAGGIALGGCVSPTLPRRLSQTTARDFSRPFERSPIVFSTSPSACDPSAPPVRASIPNASATRLVVHNYGHGGSGWSLSWGSSTIAVSKALAQSPDRVAVVGCGVLGLTSALLAQAAGKRVTIYAREMILADFVVPRALRIVHARLAHRAVQCREPRIPALWEEMARTSLKTFRSHLGLPGDPVRWIDRYVVSDLPAQAPPPLAESEPQFAAFGSRLQDLLRGAEILRPADTPFRAASVSRRSVLMFNIASYSQMLMTQFRLAGGRIEHREFHDPRGTGGLPEKVVIDCTGYGARALWRDESVVPVRGQMHI